MAESTAPLAQSGTPAGAWADVAIVHTRTENRHRRMMGDGMNRYSAVDDLVSSDINYGVHREHDHEYYSTWATVCFRPSLTARQIRIDVAGHAPAFARLQPGLSPILLECGRSSQRTTCQAVTRLTPLFDHRQPTACNHPEYSEPWFVPHLRC